LRSKTKTISFEKFDEYFCLDDTSPSGLRWKKKIRYKRMKVGDVAGCCFGRDLRYWIVGFEGKQYKVHRIIICLMLKKDIDENVYIQHKNNKSDDNSLSNLLVIEKPKDEKICQKCKVFKPHHCFSTNRRLKSGLSLYCNNCWSGSYDGNKYDVDFSKHFVYSEDSPTKLRWSEDKVTFLGNRTKIKKGDFAGCLKTKYVRLDLVNYSIPKIILRLHGYTLEKEDIVYFIDGNGFNFTISNLGIQKPKILQIRERKKKFRDRVRINKDNSIQRKMISSAKERAKKQNLDINISWEDIVIPEICPILKIPLVKGKVHITANSPSLDRKDPKKGYIKDNIWVISSKANTMKSDCDRDFLLLFADWVYNEYR